MQILRREDNFTPRYACLAVVEYGVCLSVASLCCLTAQVDSRIAYPPTCTSQAHRHMGRLDICAGDALLPCVGLPTHVTSDPNGGVHGSKRAYQTQFRRWNFPSKQNPAHKDDRLVARVKELWESNLSQAEMLRILTQEDGFEIKHRELMRVRARNRWLLRTSNTDRASPNDAASGLGFDPAANPEISSSSSQEVGQQEVVEKDAGREGDETWEQFVEANTAEQEPLRKRRRRDHAHPGPPSISNGQTRFPSETTIDESRVVLGLDTKLYQEVRAHFAQICDEDGVSKKTVAGPERWEFVKHRLIQGVPHLQSVMWVNEDNAQGKKLALDVICTDITKRLRSMEQKLTIADAKNVLGINPQEYRSIRRDFVQSRTRAGSANKTDAGSEHWEEMKEKWRADSSILQRTFAAGPDDPSYAEKLRAVDVIARDVMKRLRDGQTKRNVHRKQEPTASIRDASHATIQIVLEDTDLESPPREDPDGDDPQQLSVDHDFDPSTPTQYSHGSNPLDARTINSPHAQVGTNLSPVRRQDNLRHLSHNMQHRPALRSTLPDSSVMTHNPSHHRDPLLTGTIVNNALPADPQIDSSLPMLLSGHSQALESQHVHSPFHMAPDLSPGMAHSPHPYAQNPYGPPLTPRLPVAVYLRLHPSSPVTVTPSVWIATLTARTFEELRQVAVKDFPGMVCGRIDGILGQNMTIVVSKDDELTAYLLTVLEGRNSAGSPPCFYVQILPAGDRSTYLH